MENTTDIYLKYEGPLRDFEVAEKTRKSYYYCLNLSIILFLT